MKANTDWYLRQGVEHRIAEDYVLTNQRHLVLDANQKVKKNIPGPIKGNPFGILCDGCSSSLHTDIGARIIAHQAAAYSHLWKFPDPKQFFTAVFAAARTSMRDLMLPSESLNATLLTVHVDADKKYIMRALGDGVFAGRTLKGDIVFTEVCFPSNAPAYLGLLCNTLAYQTYCEEFGRKVTIRNVRLTPSGDSYEVAVEEREEIELPMDNCGGPLWIDAPLFLYTVDSMEAVAIMSDGVSSFLQYDRTATGTKTTAVPVESVIWEVMSFKRYGGHFVQARCDKAFAKFEKMNWRNVDDFSIAAIHSKEDPNA